MNLTQNDLRLFELLDWEVDKTLSFGCNVKMSNWDIITLASPLYTSVDKKFVSLKTCSWPFNFDIRKEECEILWHYPAHWDVLRYCKKQSKFDEITLWENYTAIYYIDNGTDFIDLDLTKPIQNYSEEAKAELIEFLENIN